MRDKAKKLNGLLEEFKELKQSQFGECSFRVVDNSDPQQKRYNQLFAFFYPEFRWDGWLNPLDGSTDIRSSIAIVGVPGNVN